jgi:hypothetical protein
MGIQKKHQKVIEGSGAFIEVSFLCVNLIYDLELLTDIR